MYTFIGGIPSVNNNLPSLYNELELIKNKLTHPLSVSTTLCYQETWNWYYGVSASDVCSAICCIWLIHAAPWWHRLMFSASDVCRAICCIWLIHAAPWWHRLMFSASDVCRAICCIWLIHAAPWWHRLMEPPPKLLLKYKYAQELESSVTSVITYM